VKSRTRQLAEKRPNRRSRPQDPTPFLRNLSAWLLFRHGYSEEGRYH
jgi:hypothetical protein